MNLQDYLQNQLQTERASRFGQSDQLSLGELIAKLEPIVKLQPARIKEWDREAVVVYDFEYLFPTEFRSWRGSYAELALGFADYRRQPPAAPMPVTEFLAMCQKTVGATFHGYKGGDYLMGKNTPVWVANWGNSGNTALVEVVDDDSQVILMTGWREF